MHHLNIEKEKVTFRRNEENVSSHVVPDVLLRGKLPDNAVYGLETHMDYIIKKYGLMKERDT